MCKTGKGIIYMSANKVRVDVCGTEYVVLTTDEESYVKGLAEKLDADMKVLMKQVPSASVASAAILVALDYLDDLKKTQSGADNMRTQIREYLEESAKAKQAAEDAHNEVERLRREIGYIRDGASGAR